MASYSSSSFDKKKELGRVVVTLYGYKGPHLTGTYLIQDDNKDGLVSPYPKVSTSSQSYLSTKKIIQVWNILACVMHPYPGSRTKFEIYLS